MKSSEIKDPLSGFLKDDMLTLRMDLRIRRRINEHFSLSMTGRALTCKVRHEVFCLIRCGFSECISGASSMHGKCVHLQCAQMFSRLKTERCEQSASSSFFDIDTTVGYVRAGSWNFKRRDRLV